MNAEEGWGHPRKIDVMRPINISFWPWSWHPASLFCVAKSPLTYIFFVGRTVLLEQIPTAQMLKR